MSQQEKRIYLGHGKRVKDYDLINFSLCISDIPTSSPFEYKGKKYIKLVIGAKKETDQYGKTHSIWLDTFKPQKQNQEENDQPRRPSEEAVMSDGGTDVDDIPF